MANTLPSFSKQTRHENQSFCSFPHPINFFHFLPLLPRSLNYHLFPPLSILIQKKGSFCMSKTLHYWTFAFLLLVSSALSLEIVQKWTLKAYIISILKNKIFPDLAPYSFPKLPSHLTSSLQHPTHLICGFSFLIIFITTDSITPCKVTLIKILLTYMHNNNDQV